MKIKILFTAGLLAMLSSCSKDNEVSAPDEQSFAPIYIEAEIGNGSISRAVTRAEKSTWSTNDRLGVYLTTTSIDALYKNSVSYKNVPFTFTGKGFKSTALLLDESEATVYAYYPYVDNLPDVKAVPVNITTQTDHLYGKSETKVNTDKRNVNITMKHALTQLVFKMKKTSQYTGEGKLTNIVIENTGTPKPIQTEGTYNVSTGAVTTTKAGTLTFPLTATLTDAFANYSTIVFPVSKTAGKDMMVTFTIDGKKLKYIFPASTEWLAGNRNIYTISLDSNGLSIGGGENPEGGSTGVTIEPWKSTTEKEAVLIPII